MFDIVALDTITIDSLMIKVNTIDQQGVIAYKRAGSHFGNEMNSLAWTPWGIDTAQVNNIGDLKMLNYSDELLYLNDTLGVYLHMQNNNSRLSYQSVPSSLTFADSQLEIASGSGISYTYGITYYPRNFSGEIFYHHGFNPSGNCTSERIPVEITVSQPNINLGIDTILYISQSILLNNNLSFSSYLWSNNSTTPQLLIDTTNFNVGNNTIWIEATDIYGCKANDTITVTFSNPTDIKNLSASKFILFPNPTNGIINIDLGKNNLNNTNLKVIDIFGKVIYNTQITTQKTSINLSNYSKGIYLIQFSNQNGNKVYKVIKK